MLNDRTWTRVRLAFGALTLAMALGVAGAAQAVPYTFDADLGTAGLQPILGFDTGNAIVDILPVGAAELAALAGSQVTLDGVVSDFLAQDWFLFRLDVQSGSVTSVGVGHPPALAEGLGYYADPGATPSSGVINPTLDDMPEFFFAGGLTGLSDALFTTYYFGELPAAGIDPVIPAGTVSFMINDGFGAFSTTADTVLVPEPSTFALLGLGLGGLAVVGRRRR